MAEAITPPADIFGPIDVGYVKFRGDRMLVGWFEADGRALWMTVRSDNSPPLFLKRVFSIDLRDQPVEIPEKWLPNFYIARMFENIDTHELFRAKIIWYWAAGVGYEPIHQNLYNRSRITSTQIRQNCQTCRRAIEFAELRAFCKNGDWLCERCINAGEEKVKGTCHRGMDLWSDYYPLALVPSLWFMLEAEQSAPERQDLLRREHSAAGIVTPEEEHLVLAALFLQPYDAK